MKILIRRMWRTLAARPAMQKVNQLMLDCSLSALGLMNHETDEVSGELHFIKDILPLYATGAAPVMVDVGANCGSYAQLLLKHHPKASLFAFEPNPKTYQLLEQKFAQTGVTLVNKGLGREESVLKFYDRADHDGSSEHGSLYKDVIEGIHKAKAIELDVDIVPLDSFAAQNDIPQISLLKIDTEGHELEVLRGASDLLSKDKIDLLHIEFNEMNIVSRVFFRDFAKILPNHIPYRLLPNAAICLANTSPLRTELFAYQNLVFIHKRFQPDKVMRPTA